METLFANLIKNKIYSCSELMTLLKSQKERGDVACYNKIRDAVRAGVLVKLGRDKYILANDLALYRYELSEAGQNISNKIVAHFPSVDYVIFESLQLNEFISHQIGNNVIFVYSERTCMDFIFEMLKDESKTIMFDPGVDLFYRQLGLDSVIIKPLITRTPHGNDKHTAGLEKILVDIVADKVVNSLIEDEEIKVMYKNALSKYALNKWTAISYAKRRNAEQRVRMLLE